MEKVESLFEKTVNEEEAPKTEDPSTLEAIKNAFNNMWGDKKDETAGEPNTEEKTEEKKEEEKPEEKKEEKAGEKKEDTKEEEKEQTEEKKEEPKKEEEKKSEEPEKKDGEKKKDEKKEGEKKAEEPAKEEKKSEPKQLLVKEPIVSTTVFSDVAPVSTEALKASREALKKLDDADEERVKREAAQNALETFIYDTKDKLNNDEFGSCATGKKSKIKKMILFVRGELRNFDP